MRPFTTLFRLCTGVLIAGTIAIAFLKLVAR